MHCDLVHISLPERHQDEFRVHALDFPESRGFVKEELLITPAGAGKRALDNLKPIVRSIDNREISARLL